LSTNSGLSPIQPYTIDQRIVGARLCHFPSNESTLLSGHKDWIDRYFIPKMKQHPNAWIDFIGSASRSGSVTRNMTLSHRRIEEVEKYIKRGYPDINVNLRLPQGATDAASFSVPESNDEGYWRAVLIRWYGVPLPVETPVYPPEKPKVFKKRKYVAPKGCWCVVGVDSFGVPVKAAVTGGTCTLTLLNDKGEQYKITGAGVGLGLGANAGPEHFQKPASYIGTLLKEIGVKAGDLGNISDTIKDLKLTGPNETNGGILKRLTWAADLKLKDINGEGFFTIYNGDAHFVMGGAELGFIFFGLPPVDPINGAKYLTGLNPWAFYASAGLGTLKGSLGVSVVCYAITGTEKLPD
jgi:hypothetical protein